MAPVLSEQITDSLVYLIPGYVHIKSCSSAGADVGVVSILGVREECSVVVPMQGYIQHTRVIQEDTLCAIAVVNIPVHYQNSGTYLIKNAIEAFI